MKTLAFFDCPTGIAGDMCLGALVDAGVPLAYLQTQLAQLALSEPYALAAVPVRRNGIAATQVQVQVGDASDPGVATGGNAGQHPPERHLADILALIQAAPLPQRAIAWSCEIFERLAAAEGAVHGIDPAQVHFHEVGATDAIVDIVGTCLGLDWLQVAAVYCSPLPTGSGTVKAAHGRLPVPAPAVLKLLAMAQMPIYSNGLRGELITPTGAAIATTLCTQFGEPPAMVLQRVGLGAGNRDFALPNMLRLWLGQVPETSPLAGGTAGSTQGTHPHHESPPAPDHSHPSSPAQFSHHPHPHYNPLPGSDHSQSPEHPHPHNPHPARPSALEPPASQWAAADAGEAESAEHSPSEPLPLTPPEAPGGLETVVVLETQVDDLTPQAIGYVSDRLLHSGALDVFTQGVTMKKSRPGHLITVIVYPDQVDQCEGILFAETTTLGIRRQMQQRQRLHRAQRSVHTPWGPVTLKVAWDPHSGACLNAHPEYEDCARLARAHQVPWQTVHRQALVQWQMQEHSSPKNSPLTPHPSPLTPHP